MNFKKIPFSVSILILFTSLILSMSIALIISGTQTSLAIREKFTLQLVDEFQNALKREFQIKLDNADAIQYEMVHSPDTLAYQHNETSDITSILRSLSAFYRLLPGSLSAYVGLEDGRLILLQELETALKFQNYQIEKNIPAETVYRLRHINFVANQKVEDIAFLDKNFETLMQYRSYDPTYDPIKRPWYKAAIEAQNTVLGKPYKFSDTDYTGLTISRPLRDQKGVVGLDVAIELTDQALDEHKLSPSATNFIFMSDGTIISHPRRNNLSEIDKQLIAISLENLDTSKEKISIQSRIKDIGDFQIFLAPNFMNKYSEHHLAVIAPVSELNAETDKLRIQSISVFIVILTIGLFVIFYAAKQVSKSIGVLSEKSQKIGQFDLDESFAISTRIKELNQLSETLEQMRSGLQEFGRYVPRQLVKQIVQNDTKLDLMGETREITALFTDIESFTSISESLPPDALLSQTSEYFEIFAPIIDKHHGIIDKYIGDSVMAFWNAPEKQNDHAYHACLAALEVKKALKIFNKRMKEEGKPAFNTRIGLHTGPSIVGNVGAEDRKNFTIFGSTVNLASRLEGMNKRYNSNLLVSDSVYEKIKGRLLCRPLEKVFAKGSSEAVTVYEVLGSNCHENIDKVCRLSHKSFEEFYAGNITSAIDLLKEIIILYP
ncbi:adenylate/guanylate cyclase domain-containing protein, partial [Curvivirga aplysinae]|uniref:adenylate/guanylate cyclase domain-containing protein n=1 Tax=Curvivirga aplysinae TaxID=2529852 RepID=UPI0012BD5D5C